MRLIRWTAFFLLCSFSALGQVNTGEIRLKVTDPSGATVTASVEVVSQGNQFSVSVATNDQGTADIHRVPYGVYLITTKKHGFKPISKIVQVGSAIPIECAIRLEIAPVNSAVTVNAEETLIDPDRPSSIMEIGSKQIEDRVLSLPGRSVQDLVVTQPGWLYEGNAVLHPRGSEYQTQFVIDGIPLTDNRSPSFGPEISADDVESMSIYTAGFPAEYGRKMGGVVELNTRRNPNAGLHGQWILSGGTYDTLGSYGQIQESWGKNTFGATASGGMSAHYLNPVVPENFTNNGTVGDFSVKYERDFTENDRLIMSVRHELSRFEIPNELVQQDARQLQTGDNFETMGTVNYQHIFSQDSLGTLEGMVRNNASDLYSNPLSTPIIAFQHNYFDEGYFKGTYSLHHGNQEFKAGIESDNTFLNEKFNYVITDPTQFDPDTPPTLSFADNRPDLEQSAFVEDLIRLGKWTVSAGLRWDHYQLLLNENAVSPRISVGRYFPSAKMVMHASYDRIFQTPSFENILISSSPAIDALSDDFLRLPVPPSKGNYYEGGLTKAFADRMRLDLNVYRRDVNNYADDDQLLNTGVSYPISFNHAIIYGAEGKLEVIRLGRLTGYVSYSYMVGNVWFPVSGGLFLGDDADAAVTQLNGHFPDSQDQRNTLRTRFQYQCIPRISLAGGLSYGSGLPFEFEGTEADALAEYGPEVVSRINFDRGRIRPLLAVNASLGANLYKDERMTVRFQADGDNLNNRLNVIDFGGLFSGNAIAPGRSFGLRLTTSF
ncbi:MAG TPA: TonB-dependent receptor [Silvibacterium sp.]|jgi:outer membrane cobalamin receptor|nr:TonB-dependent receptor [Silvibacterium sp.]